MALTDHSSMKEQTKHHPLADIGFFESNYKDPFAITPDFLIKRKVELANLRPNQLVGDLGCGDALVLIEAVKQSGCRGLGVESDPVAMKIARQKVKEAGLEDRILLLEEDLFVSDISQLDVLILYFSRWVLGQLSQHLEENLKSGCKVITHDFDIPAWEHVHFENVPNITGLSQEVYVYEVP